MRWVALGIGIFFSALAIIDQELITGAFAAFFLFQAVTNTGCMVSQSCGIPSDYSEPTSTSTKEPEFTEIK